MTQYDEELNDLYSLPSNVRAAKSRRMRWAGLVARIGQERGVFRVVVGNSVEKDHWGHPGIDGRIILKRIFRKWDVGYGLD
jgi:hypothetical protein